ncbi:glycosyltransferase, partial [Candidatus Dojkabacteria bacterium]|nr:glycosyltransferase [Candidatus Dojkabacteria bacterium]
MQLIIDATTTQDQFQYHGVGQYTKNLIENLFELAPEIQFKILLFEGKSTLDNFLSNEPVCKRVEIVRIGKLRSNNFLNRVWYLTQILPAVNKIKTHDSIYFCPYFWRFYPAEKIPTVLMIHDMILSELNSYSARKGIFNFIRKIQYWNAMRQSKACEAIITNSQYTKKDLLKYYPDLDNQKVYPIHLASQQCKSALDPAIVDKYLPNDWRDRGYIIYLGGALTQNKNSLGVLEAYYKFT